MRHRRRGVPAFKHTCANHPTRAFRASAFKVAFEEERGCVFRCPKAVGVRRRAIALRDRRLPPRQTLAAAFGDSAGGLAFLGSGKNERVGANVTGPSRRRCPGFEAKSESEPV
ncbi:hypothetical protein MRX96_017420 [Rhipicephalus microplus]